MKFFFLGGCRRIRTSDPLLKRQVLYQAELCTHQPQLINFRIHSYGYYSLYAAPLKKFVLDPEVILVILNLFQDLRLKFFVIKMRGPIYYTDFYASFKA